MTYGDSRTSLIHAWNPVKTMREAEMTEPTEMELRVAKAMFVCWGAYKPYESAKADADFAALMIEDPNLYIDVARAAIRAQYNATTDMLRESGINSETTTEQRASDWNAMIDAASPERK